MSVSVLPLLPALLWAGILLLLLLLSPSLSAASSSQYQVLFDSSDPGVKWQPTEFPSNSQIPGHLEQLAVRQPREQVTYVTGFPPVPEFHREFVIPGKPVIFSGISDKMDLDMISFDSLKTSGLASLSYVEVRREGNPFRRVSLRNLHQGSDSPPFFSDNLHDFYKRFIRLPKCLQCSYLPPLLEETRHTIATREHSLPLAMNKKESLLCMADGEAEVLLIDTRTYPQVESLFQNMDRVETLDSLHVDFIKFAELSTVSLFHVGLLKPGDCLYTPAHFVSQRNILTRESSIQISWRRDDWTPEEKCLKDISNVAPLSVYSFPAENYTGIMPSLDKKSKLLKKVSRLLDWMLTGRYSKAQLMEKIARDDTVVEKLQEWNPECSARSREMFSVLDVDGDGSVSDADVDSITEKSLERFLDVMEDRLGDLSDIAADQVMQRGDGADRTKILVIGKRDEL